MNICITGASGFVGWYLTDYLIKKGSRVIGVDRHPNRPGFDPASYRFVAADTTIEGDWQDAVKAADAVINLAGVNIFGRWTKARKSAIYDSRVLTTRHVANAMRPSAVLVSTSAAGFYGNRGDDVFSESASAGDDFLARVCVDWEAEAVKASEKDVRVAIARFGVVLGQGGGALAKMAPAFRLFAGGPLGDGRHWMPWIHIQDLAGALDHILENDNLSGPFNFCAPGQATNREFVRALGAALHRPAIFAVPAFILKILLGELGGFLLYSQRAAPERLIYSGYQFRYPEIKAAMAAVYLIGPKHA